MNHNQIKSNSGVTVYAHNRGYTGSGIGIYTPEDGCADFANINTHYYNADSCTGTYAHATAMANVMQSTAPRAMIYGTNESSGYTTSLIENDTTIGIGMIARTTFPDTFYRNPDYFVDNRVYNTGLPIFIAAGNYTNFGNYNVTSPGKAVNAITVGAVNPENNYYADYSNWKNSEIKNQKPEIANYTDFDFPGKISFTDPLNKHYTGQNVNGTSAATAYTAGMHANVLQEHPFFKKHAELVKALYVSGSTIEIHNEWAHDTDNSAFASVGVVNYRSLVMNTRSAYWHCGNDQCFDENDEILITEGGISANHRYRIAIAWLSPAPYVAIEKTLSQDIDLYVYQNGQLLAASSSPRNPYEMVDFETRTAQDLQIIIRRYANSGIGDVKLGYNMWIEP